MTGEAIGERFARLLAEKQFGEIADLLREDVQFRGMTPRRLFVETTSAGVIERVLKLWFEDTDHIEKLLAVETGTIGTRHRVGYRMRVRNHGGLFDVEQQAYFDVDDGRISALRILCSGYMPVR